MTDNHRLRSDNLNRADLDEDAERAYALIYFDAEKALQIANSVLTRADALDYQRGVVRALIISAAVRCRRLDLAGATAHLERVGKILVRHPDRLTAARLRFWEGEIAFRRAGYRTAMEKWGLALKHFHTIGDRYGQSDVIQMMAAVHVFMGEYTAGSEALAEARQTKEEIGDQYGLARCLNNEGLLLIQLGEIEDARRAFERALAVFNLGGAKSYEVIALVNLGFCCGALNEHERAVTHLEACLQISREIGEPMPETRALIHLGTIYHRKGDDRRASQYFEQAKQRSRALGDRRTEFGATLGLGRVALTAGQPEHAIAQVSDTLDDSRTAGLSPYVAEAHEMLSEAYEASGDHRRALQHHQAFHREREAIQRELAALRAEHHSALAELRRTKQDVDAQLLEARLYPHFLFNSLHSLSELIATDPCRAKRVVQEYGELLRLALMQSGERRTTVNWEMDFVTAYLRVEQLKRGDIFSFSIECDAAIADAIVPHLLLQPLVENALLHGLLGHEGKAHLSIRARPTGPRLRLTVADSGKGISSGASPKGFGIGLSSTKLRLQRMFGADHAFRIKGRPQGGTVVSIDIPCVRAQEDPVFPPDLEEGSANFSERADGVNMWS